MFPKDSNTQQELSESAPALLPLREFLAYEVPEGYFEQFPLLLLKQISQHSSGIQEVPQGYFEGFAARVMKSISSEMEEVIAESGIDPTSEILSSIGKVNPYQAPIGYFEEFAQQVKPSVEIPAKVIQMAPRFSMMRYAIAAALTGLLGLSIFQLMNTSSSTTDQSTPYLAANEIISEDKYEEVLQTISGEEIIQYLELTGDDINAALVAEAAVQDQLPAPEDYWMDEQTLDHFLNSLNLPTLN